MRFDYPMMMAGSTTITASRMDQPTGVPATAAFYPATYMSTPQPPLSSSSRPQPHRRSSSASTGSHASHYHYHQQQQQQQQLLFYPPPFVPYQQMPYHQQLPFHHQRMHNLLHGSQYATPYGTANPYGNQHQHQHQTHGYRPHYLLPHAPPTSQQHSSSSSFSSAQQLSALQKQQLQSQVQEKTQPQPQAASSKTHMPLFSAFSLRGSSHNKMTTHSSASQQQPKSKKKTVTTQQQQQQQQSGTVGIKPPTRAPKTDRNRGPVDPKELSQRLHTVLTQRELEVAARSNGSAHSLSSGAASMSPVSPLLPPANAPPQLQNQLGGDRSGRRIRSRGSGNLRAVYAANGTMPTSMPMPLAMAVAGSSSGGGGGPIRRQPFSAPHLSALVPPPSLPELERRRNRTRSLSPQLVNIRGGSSRGTGSRRGTGPDSDSTMSAQRRASSNIIPPPNAHHGVPYVPSQAAQQFAQTTVAAGGTRKSILLQKPKQPYHHNQNMTGPSPPATAKSPGLSSSTTSAPAIQHAYKDSLSLPGSKRQSLKDAADADTDDKAVKVMANREDTVEEETVDPEAEIEAEVEEAKVGGAQQPVAAAELNRVVQEHSVDWTQSDETPAQSKKEKREKKEKKEREKREKKEKANNAGDADAAKQARPLWRLKARLSSFSKDKLLASAPMVTVVAVADETRLKDDKEGKEGKEEGTVAEVAEAASVAPAADEIPRAQHIEMPTAEGAKVVSSVPEMAPENVVSTIESAVEPVVEAPAAQPASTSPSVLSFTALAKSSSFLSRFKH
ncbi:hypothetical protein SCUCBS95973_009213 [Sporothrix curviconia]|uniref:Uncharacterized protein n=1 Tax=Sporothrix curviconia TaxID=1260050 RepID=A0ABP0CT18_9PEZI